MGHTGMRTCCDDCRLGHERLPHELSRAQDAVDNKALFIVHKTEAFNDEPSDSATTHMANFTPSCSVLFPASGNPVCEHKRFCSLDRTMVK